MILLNPVDIRRIMMLQLDISALMDNAGAFFKQFFASKTGRLVAARALSIWILFPNLITMLVFGKKNFKFKN
jgi:hypothetical protein